MNNQLEFDKKIFSREAILATVYWCADRFVADINDAGDNYVVTLFPRNDGQIKGEDLEEFKLMMVHNQMRHQLSERFADLETTIVAKAFAPVRNRRD